MNIVSSNDRKDPYGNAKFLIEIDGIVQGDFVEAIIPEVVTNVIEYRTGNEFIRVRKLPGLTEDSNLILIGGIIESMELYNWYKLVRQGKMKSARKNVAITLLDEERNSGARWEVENAWPCKYSISPFYAQGRNIVVESFEITFEAMKRVQ